MTTISENQYRSVKHSLLSACYDVKDSGYVIGSSYGVSCKDGFSWSVSNDIKSVNPLGAWLLSRQPKPAQMLFEYDIEEWDFNEIYSLQDYFYQADDFFSGFIAGYDDQNVPVTELIKQTEEQDHLPVGAPCNDIVNEENFRLGVKLGKYFAKKFCFDMIINSFDDDLYCGECNDNCELV